MLVDSVDPTLQISMTFLITVTAVITALFGIVVWLVVRAQSRTVAIGDEGMPGKIAEVRTSGMVYVDGALWQAECVNHDEQLVKGEKVEIVSVDKLLLKVKKTNS